MKTDLNFAHQFSRSMDFSSVRRVNLGYAHAFHQLITIIQIDFTQVARLCVTPYRLAVSRVYAPSLSSSRLNKRSQVSEEVCWLVRLS